MEREIKKVNTKQLTVIHDAPKGPNFLPNNPAQKEPINGKKISVVVLISNWEYQDCPVPPGFQQPVPKPWSPPDGTVLQNVT